MFGSKGDIQLMSLAVVRDHCSVEVRSSSAHGVRQGGSGGDKDAEEVVLIAGKGNQK